MNNFFNKNEGNSFSKKLLHWHTTQNKREMPWKEETDPYKVWLSEIILQQTKVEQGLKYYLLFIENFPTIAHLAIATENKVLKLWEGLGYYSRARNLHYTAKYIVNELHGEFPKTYAEIIKLKGVGSYTAAAISSFCFNEAKAVVDGNVKRVLSRFFLIEKAIDTTAGKKTFDFLAQELINKKTPALYNQAIMDFGATVCKPKQALCNVCVLNTKCKAYKTDTVAKLPVKAKKIQVKERHFLSFVIKTPQGYIIEQRKSNDIWKKLYQFPLFELQEDSLNIKTTISQILGQTKYAIEEKSNIFKQKLTHQTIHIQFIAIKTTTTLLTNKEKYTYTQKLTNFAFPKIFILYLQSKKLI